MPALPDDTADRPEIERNSWSDVPPSTPHTKEISVERNGKHQDDAPNATPLQQLATVMPGDVVDVWMEQTYLVKTVYLCEENVGGRTYEWRWMFLDDGSLVEVSPDGYFRYKQHTLLKQGSGEYESIVAQDGALVRFEQHVREDDSGRRPVHVTVEGKEYRITSTGTVQARRVGDEPALIPWQNWSKDAEENVYFGMVDTADESNMALGLWTTHVCVSLGRALEETNISSVFRK
jgi:hypothetical protein